MSSRSVLGSVVLSGVNLSRRSLRPYVAGERAVMSLEELMRTDPPHEVLAFPGQGDGWDMRWLAVGVVVAAAGWIVWRKRAVSATH